MSDERTTRFGYREVSESAKEGLVARVFDSVAGRYDLMNDLMSAGIHRVWKRVTVELSAVRAGHRVLDVAGGTGDLALRFATLVGDTGQVVLSDINASMLAQGRARLHDAGICANVEFVLADAEELPFAEHSFDCVTIGFGLRNVTRKERALESMLRVLKPGGRALVLEFSRPTSEWVARLYDAYSFGVLPKLGRLVTGDEDSYRYLVESIRVHPDQDTLLGMMEDAGFVRCDFHNLSGGIVAVHRGFKP